MNLRRTLPALVIALAALVAPAGASAKLPVPWTADSAFSAQAAHPNSSPPGANDFSCKPSKRHPEPVVLVHGLAANQTVNWSTMSPLLKNAGYCVFALTYGTTPNVNPPFYQPGGLLRMEDSASQLRNFVKRIRHRTHAKKVDIVGHSEGSLMPNQYVKFRGGANKVRRYVGITPLWDGTNLAGLATIATLGAPVGLTQAIYNQLQPYCDSCHEFLHGSAFLNRMNDGGAAVPGVKYTMLMTRNDELVSPYTSGRLSGRGVKNIVVQDQCSSDQSEHLSMAYDPVVAWDILNALDPEHPKAGRCTLVLPGVGAPSFHGG